LSGDLYHNKSCLIVKVPENKQLGVMIEALISKYTQQEIYIEFVDDIGFVSAGSNY